jgi:uncharacterized protein Yka (UPF0111/DUF47 family)
MAWLARRRDDEILSLFEASGRNAQRAGELLREMIGDYPEHAELAREVLLCEQEGDRIAHDIIYRLHESTGKRAPFESTSVYGLATALDDIVDHAEEAADQLGLYSIEAPMEQAVGMADVLAAATARVVEALTMLRSGGDLSSTLVEIHRLENEGDRLSRDGVAALFADGIDPMVVIRWKDIYASLEAAVDACERVAHLVEGISLNRRRR